MTIDTQKLRDGPYLRDGKETMRIMNEAADTIDAQVAEIDRLTKALRVSVLALAHAMQEHGAIYRPAYEAVDAALSQGEQS